MIGTHHSQSPMSFHYAREVLGHTQSHPFAKLFQTYYYDKGFSELFTRNDYGGCTAGVPKTLDLHVRGNACKLGPVEMQRQQFLMLKNHLIFLKSSYKSAKLNKV